MEYNPSHNNPVFCHVCPEQGFFISNFVVIPIKSGTEGAEVGLAWIWECLKCWDPLEMREFLISLGMPRAREHQARQNSLWDHGSAPDPHPGVLAGCAFLGSTAQHGEGFFWDKGLRQLQEFPKPKELGLGGKPRGHSVQLLAPGQDEFSLRHS